jgi:hypothetical protein
MASSVAEEMEFLNLKRNRNKIDTATTVWKELCVGLLFVKLQLSQLTLIQVDR